MTGLLRFAGMLNAAVWLGAAIFCSTSLLVALHSREAIALIGASYFEQVSGGITQIIFQRLFYLQILCAVLAWLHAIGEWLYLGRIPRRFWTGLLFLLFLLSLLGSIWLCPKLLRLQRARYAPSISVETRLLLERSFRTWNGVFQAVNVVLIGGVGLYFWRLGNPQDEPRFVVPSKFRS